MKAVNTCVRYLFLIYALGLPSLSNADYASAVTASKEKDYAKAYKEFREMAELGHAPSQYALGAMYYNGHGVDRNTMLAYGWIRLASDAGNAQAQAIEPKIRAEIDEENVARAKNILDKFTPEAVSSRLMPRVIANCEYQNATPPVAIRRPAPAYPSDALYKGIQGSVVVELFIATDSSVREVRIIDSVPRGIFDSTVRDSVMKWKVKPAMRDGKPISSWAESAVVFKIQDSFVGGPLADYLKKVRVAAENGDPTAQYLHGLILSGYPEYMKPWSEALPWMMKAAQGGSAPAQFRVGLSLLRGRGCESDEVKATDWLLRAAQQDFPDAQIEVARLFLKTGPNYDPKKGVFWLERAAGSKDVSGKKWLAALLAASTSEPLRDSKYALKLVDEITRELKGDASVEEIRAAALAATGDYEGAAVAEKKAIALAKKNEWDLTDLNDRLQHYQSRSPWYGDLLAF